MDVIAYHPDSDWGPTHREHPMLNRTLVKGEKIDNSGEAHRPIELIEEISIGAGHSLERIYSST